MSKTPSARICQPQRPLGRSAGWACVHRAFLDVLLEGELGLRFAALYVVGG